MPRPNLLATTSTLLALVLAGVCAPAQESAATQPVNKAERVARKIEKQVEAIRGLKFKEPVKIGVYDAATLKSFLEKLIEKELTPARVDPYVRGLKALELLPKDIDFKKVFLDVMSEQVAGFYDPDSKELRLIDRAGPSTAKSMMSMLGMDMDAITMAHELTHALQDQHFGLKSLPIEVIDDDDLVLASQSLVEGDATVVMMAWPLAKKGLPTDRIFSKETADALSRLGDLSAMPGAEAVAAAPAFIREGLMFPYIGGLKFCLAIGDKDKGFQEIDKAFRAPPLSTEQVLHPEKFAGGAAVDYPTTLKLPDLAATLGMKRVTENQLGELCTRILLDEKLKKKEATPAAAGWDGDRYALYGRDEARDLLVWVSTWDTDADADEFDGALGRWLQAVHEGKTSEESDVTSARFAAPDDTWDAIAKKGRDVILLRGVPKTKLVPVLQRIFEETQRAERTKAKP